MKTGKKTTLDELLREAVEHPIDAGELAPMTEALAKAREKYRPETLAAREKRKAEGLTVKAAAPAEGTTGYLVGQAIRTMLSRVLNIVRSLFWALLGIALCLTLIGIVVLVVWGVISVIAKMWNRPLF